VKCWVEGSSYYDFSDRATWFKDKALTEVAEDRADVRYVANKSGPGMFEVDGLQLDEDGRYYIEANGI
jgi:hypothetical protein